MDNLQTTVVKRNFPSYFRNTFAAALGIEILCITSAEIGENLGLYYFGFNQIGISIAIALGFAFAGFTTFVTILGKSHGKHIHGCCSVLETDNNLSFFQNLKTTLTDFGKGIKKLTRFHNESGKKHILKESLFILVTAESGCIIIAEIVGLALYQHSLILSLPIALLAGTSIIVVTTYDKRSRRFLIPILVLILISMPFLMTSVYGTGFHFHTFTTFDSPPDASKQSLFQNLTYVEGYLHGTHFHPGYIAGATSAKETITASERMTINGKQYLLDIIILKASNDLDVPREFSFKLRDPTTGQIQENVTYLFTIKKYGNTIFEDTFQRDNGNLFVKIIPENPFKLFFEEENKIISSSESLAGLAGQLEVIRGPILDYVGVYEISIGILTLGSYSTVLESPPSHSGFLTLSDIQNHEILDSRFGEQEIISDNYLGKIENFQYIEDKNIIKFDFPLRYLELESRLTPDLQMLLYIPKTFSPFLAKDISVFGNELPLTEQFIERQDLNDDIKLIRFVIPSQSLLDPKLNNKENIEFVITPTHPNSFPLSSVTNDRNYDIFLAWDPPNIPSGNELSLFVQANDQSYVTKQLDYDLIVSQNNEEFLKINGKTSQTKPPQPITVQIPEDLSGLTEFEFTFNKNPNTRVEFPIFIGEN